ncbi:MAG: phage portal protein, partial [Clostridium sp.]
TIESNSPLGVSVYSRAIDLIKEADKQYSRILWEFEGSELAVNASSDCFTQDRDGKPILPEGKNRLFKTFEYDVKEGGKPWETFSPDIRDESLFNGLNNLLRNIEFNVGLAYGTISDPNNVEKTAEEIKSSKQRSYQTVKDIQNKLEDSLDNLLYSMGIWGQIYKLCNGKYEVSYNWDDSIIVDKDKELESMRLDVASGVLRPEIYLSKKYGVSEEEALKMIPDSLEEPDPLKFE